jgi:hypothetical protein
MKLTRENIQKPRSIGRARRYIGRINRYISTHASAREKALKLTDKTYDKFAREFCPLYEYARLRYPGEQIRIRIFMEQIRFDGAILSGRGQVKENVQIAYPKDWKEFKENGGKPGSGEGIPNAHTPQERTRQYLAQLKQIVSKKLEKDYSDCTLLFVVDLDYLQDAEQMEHAALFAAEMKAFQIRQEAYLLFMPCRSAHFISEGILLNVMQR